MQDIVIVTAGLNPQANELSRSGIVGSINPPPPRILVTVLFFHLLYVFLTVDWVCVMEVEQSSLLQMWNGEEVSCTLSGKKPLYL